MLHLVFEVVNVLPVLSYSLLPVSLQFYVTYDLYIAAFVGAGVALLALVSVQCQPGHWIVDLNKR